MITLHIEPANKRQTVPTYEFALLWYVYASKVLAADIIKYVVFLALAVKE